MLSSLGKLFSITSEDRLLSVLPLHHTFEFSCGLLMPLSLGASIIYLDEVTGEQLVTVASRTSDGNGWRPHSITARA